MSLLTAMISELNSESVVTDYVGDRISISVGDKNPTLPYIVIRLVGSTSVKGLEGSYGHRVGGVVVECHASTGVEAMDIANAVIGVLDGFKGPTLGVGDEAMPCGDIRLDDIDTDVIEIPGGSEAATYMVAPVFQPIWHKEAAPAT
jgi:hypothetical protein